MSVSSIPAQVRDSLSKNENESGSWLTNFVSHNIADLKSFSMWRGCLAEFIGLFLLAFFTIGVGTSREGDPKVPLLQIALGVGFFLAVIICSLSTVSGGHVNPAISIGFLVTNQITVTRFVCYSLFQTLGAVAGTGMLQAVLPSNYEQSMGLFQPGPGIEDHQALVMEMVITCLLLFGTMAFIDSHREDMQGSIPLMIGLIVIVNVLAGGSVSGGCMNPARAFGSAAITGNMNKQWIYWLGPMVGAVIGAWLYDSFFSTRPITIISRVIERSEPTRRYHSSKEDDPNAELSEISEQTKLQRRV